MIGLSSYKKEICLVGGGHSHLAVIKKLGMHPIPGTRVVLISNDKLTPYSGMLPGLIAGHYTVEDCHIDLYKLCQWAGIQFMQNEVLRIDPLHRKIYCQQGVPLCYDLLSINVGSQPALSGIEGADRYGHPVKPVKSFLQAWHRWLDSVSLSNHLKRIVIIGGGAAGIEVLLAIYYKLRHTIAADTEMTLVCATPIILNTHNVRVQKFFEQHLHALGVTVIKGKYVRAINEHQLQLDDNTTLNYEFAVWAIDAGAESWPAKSGLMCDNKGFIQVDQYLRSISHADIFATGDCAAFLPSLLPKAGVYAVRQGPVLANNISAHFEKKQWQAFKPQKQFLSLLTAGERYAVASKGYFFAKGQWVWLWKNLIDRTFVARFNPQSMASLNNSDKNL